MNRVDYLCDCNCENLIDRTPKDLSVIDGYCQKYGKELSFYDWFEKCEECLSKQEKEGAE